MTRAELGTRVAALPPGLQPYALAQVRRLCGPPLPPRQRPRPPHVRSPDDELLYAQCRTDRELFARTFFAHWCTTETFSCFHIALCTLANSRVTLRGQRDVMAAPRGAAKTTWRKINIAHDCVYAHERFILYLTNRAELSESHVREIRDELEHNPRLLEVYGPQVGSLWNQAEFITASGVHVLAASRASQVRGLVARGARPTKVYIDDIEHPDHVLSQRQRAKTAQWFFGDILKLGQPETNIDVSGTILHPESLLSELLANPGFHGQRYQAVLRYADASAVPLWQQWRTLFLNLADPDRVQTARAFFDANAEAMLAGTEVLWPERESYYDLMVMRLVEGETAFQLEKQNEPRRSTRTLFAMDEAGYCTLQPQGLRRTDGVSVAYSDLVDLAAFYDPTPDKQSPTGDTAACVVLGKDAQGFVYVLDAYVAVEPSTDAQLDAIVALLWAWQVPRLGLESNGFQSLLAGQLQQKLAAKAQAEGVPWSVLLVPVHNSRNKVLRIRSLEAPIVNRWLWFADTVSGELLRQFREFIPLDNAGRDDAPDATEGAWRVLQQLV